jgi:hypothetical protein
MMNMKTLVAGIGVSLCFCMGVSAVPLLQIDISPGTYIGNASDDIHNSETVLATSSEFTLFALINLDGARKYDLVNGAYCISAAVVPQIGDPASLGSFSVNGEDCRRRRESS